MMLAATKKLEFAHLHSWIGQEDPVSDTIRADLVRKCQATFDLSGGAPQTEKAAPHGKVASCGCVGLRAWPYPGARPARVQTVTGLRCSRRSLDRPR
jgi:hypothetical protein